MNAPNSITTWNADWKTREALTLAPWAMHAEASLGRVHNELPHPFRSPYQRDRDRIVHSAAFRRLAHKTQVFTGYHGDYHRSRLTQPRRALPSRPTRPFPSVSALNAVDHGFLATD